MFTLRSVIRTSLLVAPMFLAAGVANAATVTGSSFGTFSNISGCGGDNCRITNQGGNGPNTRLEWGHTFFTPGSTLTGVDRNFSAPTNANDLRLGELVWYNRATAGNVTPDDFSARYRLQINFTSPNNTSDFQFFDLDISNPVNNTGDDVEGLTLASLAGLTFNLGNVIMSDLKYMLAPGGGGDSFNDNRWYNPEDNLSRLYITADFTERPNEVPEPASLALLGAGLLGVGALRRRQSGRARQLNG